jgi:hypothetical protein
MARASNAQLKPVAEASPPAAQPRTDARPLLDQVLQSALDQLATARRQRADAVRAVVDDPEGAAQRVQDLDATITQTEARIRTLNDAIAQREEQAIAAQAKARLDASAADRAAIVRVAQERVGLAQAVDDALTAARAALSRYAQAGHACSAFMARSLTELHAGDLLRIDDAMRIDAQRASGAGPDAAASIAYRIRGLIAAFGPSAHLHRFVPADPVLETAMTLAATARADAEWLAHRFGGPK